MSVARRPPALLQVADNQAVSAHRRRIVLAGASLADFPLDRPGAHIKLFFAPAGETQPALPIVTADGPVWPTDRPRPIVRTYSVRHVDPARCRLSVDFVMHADDGPAAAWAATATSGATVGLAGPGGPMPMLAAAPYYLLVGDLSALPAIEALLAGLPDTARGDVFIHVPDEDDAARLPHVAPGISLHWRYGPADGRVDHAWCAQIIAQAPAPEHGFAWVAGENATVIALRRMLRDRGWPREAMYAVPYWKSQLTEERYHAERHQVMDAFDVD
ncbi:siderophore-interacting protein [Salinisphaera sp. Q1T1-3]|uniref:siderophore-interacting protein n=1 Tax=Salinisphaera sp. Q1T1-3 TaxID=2321229 RepID=UPI000E71F52A|nr:siderophore-interacting protein [Salinisphaera sp. Q1T1-3]RJS94839.1 siderophore-interacting protein [Salinisphaera sp. Q1T1-3]